MSFTGFSKEALTFYQGLAKNNNKLWFEEHKPVYQKEILKPAKAFIEDMGQKLQSISPYFIADTRTNGAGSIFRIYRDTRFSKDKSPYKTFLGIFFWEGPGKKMENSGFYFHLDPAKNYLMIAAGMHIFPKEKLQQYRETVADEKKGIQLKKIMEQINSQESFSVGGAHYKQVPRGYDKAHPQADLLKFNGLWSAWEGEIPELIHTSDFLNFCFEKFKLQHPLHQWLVNF